MGWTGEGDFKHVLRQVAHGATRERLDLLATMAVEEEALAYKVVAHLLVKKLKEVKPQYRLRVFYALSAVVRQSVSRRALTSRYVERLSPQLDAVAAAMEQAPAADRRMVARVLDLWWREGVFAPSEVAKLQARFRPDAAATAAPAAGAAGAAAAAADATHSSGDGGHEAHAPEAAVAVAEQLGMPVSSSCGPAAPSLPQPMPQEYDPELDAAAEPGWAQGTHDAVAGQGAQLPAVPTVSLPPLPPLPPAPDDRPRPSSAADCGVVL